MGFTLAEGDVEMTCGNVLAAHDIVVKCHDSRGGTGCVTETARQGCGAFDECCEICCVAVDDAVAGRGAKSGMDLILVRISVCVAHPGGCCCAAGYLRAERRQTDRHKATLASAVCIDLVAFLVKALPGVKASLDLFTCHSFGREVLCHGTALLTERFQDETKRLRVAKQSSALICGLKLCILSRVESVA